MAIHISRVKIQNFRNFHFLDVHLSQQSVIVGENKSGKSNFIHALRLILDPTLPDSLRQLREEDFWDGLASPIEEGKEIIISIELQDFEDDIRQLSLLSRYLIKNEEKATASLTYKFAPNVLENDGKDKKYQFIVFGGDDETNQVRYQERMQLPLQVLPPLRDAERDLESWSRSPLRPLIERLDIEKQDILSPAAKIDEATRELLKLGDIQSLNSDIENRLEAMIGELHSVSTSLQIASTDALQLIRSLKLYIGSKKKRLIGDESLGISNIIYLALLSLELERKETASERVTTILAIEEPEAHIHPHLQRLVYRDYLRRKSGVLLTTHSPHIASVTPMKSLVLIKNHNSEGSSATSTAKLNISENEIIDLERYLDVTRGEILFARGVILVEGIAELYIVPSIAEGSGIPLDKYGISVCSVHGTDFIPYCKLLGVDGLDIPFVVITDGDPYERNGSTHYRGIDRGLMISRVIASSSSPKLNLLHKHHKWDELQLKLEELNIFIGDHTLEIDIINSDWKEDMLTVLDDLGAGPTQLSNFESAIDNIFENKREDISGDIDYVLDIINRRGKGRFAQRLASQIKVENSSVYIKSAIDRIIELVSEK